MAINKVLGSNRFIYNACLEKKQEAYKEKHETWELKQLSHWYHTELRQREDLLWLKEQNTKVIKQTIRRLLNAYDRFFGHLANYPTFKSKRDECSVLFPIETISKRNTFERKEISLIKGLQHIRFRCSNLNFQRLREYREHIRSATLSRTKSGKYYLSILLDMPNEEFVKFKKTEKSVGIDLGVKTFVITSNGERFENKHIFRKAEKRIVKAQRNLSRKKKGSNNRNKARIRLARAHETITNQRETYIHSVVNSLLEKYDIIFIEDLNVKGMLKNHHLAKAIQEIGLGRFREVLEYKAAQNGKKVEKINRFFPSSKKCSVCGEINSELTLNDRTWKCPQCGTVLDRDVNAAINILVEGERKIGCCSPESTPVENPKPVGHKCGNQRRGSLEAGSKIEESSMPKRRNS